MSDFVEKFDKIANINDDMGLCLDKKEKARDEIKKLSDIELWEYLQICDGLYDSTTKYLINESIVRLMKNKLDTGK